jgi:NitT/TauT family transport system substrate-binding protein
MREMKHRYTIHRNEHRVSARRAFSHGPRVLLSALLLAAAVLLAGCGEGRGGAGPEGEETGRAGRDRSEAGSGVRDGVTFTIAEQYGLAYAPLQVMRMRGMLEERVEGVEVSWVRLGNTAAIREAILGGRVDAGFMGIPPFLIGYDRGMEWRMTVGLSEAPLGLVTWRDDIRELGDFDSGDRIALPQPGSIQHILLSMACERELGDASALDPLLVTMNHPDGMQALLGKREISAHFTSPPYVMEELAQPGMYQVISGREAMGGEFTFIVGAVTDAFVEEQPEIAEAFARTVADAARWTEEHPEEAARMLSAEYGIEEETLAEYLRHEELEYGPEIKGVDTFIDFMHRHGYLETRVQEDEVMIR